MTAPTAPVPKSNTRTIQLCKDYKQNINSTKDSFFFCKKEERNLMI